MAPSSKSSAYAAGLAARMAEVCAGLSFSEVARRTEMNRETTRRYMTSGRASAEFLARLCEAFGVSGTWLLTGRGGKFDAIRSTDAIRTRPRSREFLGGRASRARKPASVS